MKLKMTAVHEAGHAVVAAHLRVPFTHVTIKPGIKDGSQYGGYIRTGVPVNIQFYLENKKTGEWRARSRDEIVREAKRQLTNQALVALAGRAAVEMLATNGGKGVPESGYKADEDNVKAFAEVTLGTRSDDGFRVNIAGDDFQAWRAALLVRTREIVAIPYISEAILLVALKLESEYQFDKRGVSSKDVRRVLRRAKYNKADS